MAVKTSVYLQDDVAMAARMSGVALSELVRRGLAAPEPDEVLARAAASGAADAVRDEVREIVREELRAALGELRGGSW